MAKEYAKKFYRSKAWINTRKLYIRKRIKIDGGMCEVCHKVPGYIVHHKTKITPATINDTDITLNLCNLEYVCKACHDDEHSDEWGNQSKATEQRVKYDEMGRPIPKRYATHPSD